MKHTFYNPYLSNPFDVFISHCGPDSKAKVAMPLQIRLQECFGISVFVDENSLPRGGDAPRNMEHALKLCKVAVVIFSRGFWNSDSCKKELWQVCKPTGVRHKDEVKNGVNKTIRESVDDVCAAVGDILKVRLEVDASYDQHGPAVSRALGSHGHTTYNSILVRLSAPGELDEMQNLAETMLNAVPDHIINRVVLQTMSMLYVGTRDNFTLVLWGNNLVYSSEGSFKPAVVWAKYDDQRVERLEVVQVLAADEPSSWDMLELSLLPDITRGAKIVLELFAPAHRGSEIAIPAAELLPYKIANPTPADLCQAKAIWSQAVRLCPLRTLG
ncbi:hypothetical protein WJX72_008545 [[Myrmecia] bisecta]|uniref:TIR domain-containing protein n=1 Tax=[Myrmecia] bisecta TaxID=41462 RepID=A0AAW1QFY3_9CHLO